jgi:hypothetical protein
MLVPSQVMPAGRVELWLAKERYCPTRIVNVTILTALLVGYPDGD